MARYEADIDLGNPNISHTQIIDLVGFDKTVLDVGCATGDVARVLNSRGCRVSGVEIDAESAELARPDLEELVITDLDTSPLSDHFKAGSFDVVIFADVLEHLRDPVAVLRDSLSLLAPDGRVVISIPNVAHGSVRLALLQGRWNYTETGLLDSTHIRFFTRSGFLTLLDEAGLAVDELRATVADPLRVEVSVDGRDLPPTVVEWVRDQPDALTYQFVASARLSREPDADQPAPTLVPAVAEDAVRLRDEHTHRFAEDLQTRHDLLTIRDHVIGLEARAAAAALRQAEAEARAGAAERRAARARNRAVAARQRAVAANRRARTVRRASAQREREMRRSMTWRVGRLVLAPIRILRNLAR